MVDITPRESGWMVAVDGTAIGFVKGTELHTPAGATYSVREGRGAARLWSSDNKPLVNYDREPSLAIRDVVSGTTWRLRDDWQKAATGGPEGGQLDMDAAWDVQYTLEDAQGTVPNRVKLLLAYLVAKRWGG